MKENNKGITLIALVVTIIVLLILAGVTISVLVGENGIINNAAKAKISMQKAEIVESASLELLNEATKESGFSSIDGQKAIAILKKYFTDDSVELLEKKNLNEAEYRSQTNLISKQYDNLEISLGNVLNNVTIAFQAIDYGTKTPETIVAGDTITIGQTEKFMVIKKEEHKIVAIAYDNITLTAEPQQSPTAGAIGFAETQYWTGGGDIDMTGENNIKGYLTAYQNKLDNLGAINVTVRLPSRSELWVEGVTNEMRVPGGTQPGVYWQGYWTCSVYSASENNYIQIFTSTGAEGNVLYTYSMCIRPLIEITI